MCTKEAKIQKEERVNELKREMKKEDSSTRKMTEERREDREAEEGRYSPE